jgi:ABC-type lipoprotein release transport system permease subunit
MRIVSMCARNLTRRKLRTFLSVLAIAAAACVAVAVGATTTRYSTMMIEMNTFFQGQVVVVAKNVLAIQGFPLGGALPQSMMEDIASIDGVERTVPILFNLGFRAGEASGLLPINATIGLPVEDFPLMVDESALKTGGRFPQTDSDNQVLIGCSIADQEAISTGSALDLHGQEVTVCGVIDFPSPLLERSVIMSLKLAQTVFDYPMQINMAIVKPASGITEQELADRIEERVNYVTAMTETERNDLTEPIIQVVESWNVMLQAVLLSLMFLLVVVVGMINVSERRKDFAALNAMGAPSRTVFGIVILETSIMGLLGTVLGIVLGSVGSVVLASSWTTIPYSQFISGFLEIVPPIYISKVLVMGVSACCLGGLVPAASATRMRLAEALRAEY